MKKIILTYGFIAGAIAAGLMFATMPLLQNGTIDYNNGEFVGYTGMVVSLSMVFFGIKSCRDNDYGGQITFGRAVKVGLIITLIASLMYALAWEVCYHTFASDFLDKMQEHQVEEIRKNGGGAAEIEQAVRQIETIKDWYRNPLLRFGITMTEILPVGLIITLLSAGLLRKKELISREDVKTQSVKS